MTGSDLYDAYGSRTGTVAQADPFGYEGGINLYAYTDNNPVNGVDPLGLWTFGIGVKAGITGGTGGFGASGGIKFDSTGTVSLYGSGNFIFGPGASVTLGPTVSISPGNLPTPSATGLSKGGGMSGGISLTAAPVNVSVTAPLKNNGGPGGYLLEPLPSVCHQD